MLVKKYTPGLRATAFSLLGFFVLVLLLVNAQTAAKGVHKGLTLCFETLFPSLFPFLVLSELLIARKAGKVLGKLFSRPVSALFGLSESGAAALLLGMLCGAPIGTTTAVALCERGELSREELQRLILFVNNPSAGFLIGAVGGALFGNSQAGFALFAITWLSSLLIGVFFRLAWGKIRSETKYPHISSESTYFVSDLTGSVSRGFFSLLQIFAFVVFFSCIASCIEPLLAALDLPCAGGVAIYGLLEMTSGISQAAITLSPAHAFRFTAFFSGFSGLSICLQIFSVAEKQHLPVLPYLLAKVVQGALSLCLAELYLYLFDPVFAVTDSIATFADNAVQRSGLFGILLLLPLLVLILSLWQKRRQKA